MGFGTAVVKLPYKEIRRFDHRPWVKSRAEELAVFDKDAQSRWRKLMNLCKMLKRTKADYEVIWDLSGEVAVAEVHWH